MLQKKWNEYIYLKEMRTMFSIGARLIIYQGEIIRFINTENICLEKKKKKKKKNGAT